MKASTRLRGFLRRPTPEQLHSIAAAENLTLSESEVTMYSSEFEGLLAALDRLDLLDAETPPLRWTNRSSGALATAVDDPFNTVVRWCDVPGSTEGPLKGVRVGVKDNIAVAGVPVTNGSRGARFTPVLDAIAVERLLDAGAHIVAKTNLDDYSALGTGESSFFGPAMNPHGSAYSAGGSSGGSGAAVAAGLIDLALAVDQGGSARVPASFNGVVTLLASHGRIPSFGVTHIDHTIDFICPMARTVAEVAAATDVLAGDDPRDPQWKRATHQPARCAEAVDRGVANLTIAVLDEGVLSQFCDLEVLEAFNRTMSALEQAGATITSVSVPLWTEGWNIELALLAHLGWAMAQSEGIGWGHAGYVDEARSHSFALARRLEANDYPPFYKLWMLAGRYLHDDYFNTMLAKAMNLRWTLTQQIERTFDEVDALMMPTTPTVAVKLLKEASGEAAMMKGGTRMLANTAPTNLTGNPSLAVPNGRAANGLPTSVQIVTAYGNDETAIAIGAAVEHALGVFPTPL